MWILDFIDKIIMKREIKRTQKYMDLWISTIKYNYSHIDCILTRFLKPKSDLGKKSLFYLIQIISKPTRYKLSLFFLDFNGRLLIEYLNKKTDDLNNFEELLIFIYPNYNMDVKEFLNNKVLYLENENIVKCFGKHRLIVNLDNCFENNYSQHLNNILTGQLPIPKALLLDLKITTERFQRCGLSVIFLFYDKKHLLMKFFKRNKIDIHTIVCKKKDTSSILDSNELLTTEHLDNVDKNINIHILQNKN